jgi:hypothetical protein
MKRKKKNTIIGAWIVKVGKDKNGTEYSGDTKERLNAVRATLLAEKKAFSLNEAYKRRPVENEKGFTVYVN